MARLWYGSGVVPGNQSQLACTISGTTVTIQPGAVWVDGFYGQSSANKTVSGVTGTGTVVARLDVTSRQIYFMFTTTVVQNPLANFDIPLYSVAGGVLTDVRQFCTADPSKIARGRTHRSAAYATTQALNNMGFDTVDYGTNWSGTWLFVCPYAADYLCIAQVGFTASAIGQWCDARLAHASGGTTTITTWGGSGNSYVPGNIVTASLNDIVPCKAGDQLYIQHLYALNGLQGFVGASNAFFSVRSLS
jgi:hypothetical protein